jgi:hypothetical protein
MRIYDYSKKTATDPPKGIEIAVISQKSVKRGDSASSVRSEYVEQAQFAEWLDRNYPVLLWSASAGGMRTSIGTATKMKRMGYKRGIPDIQIFEPVGEKKGLFIELKRTQGGTVSSEQKVWLEKLNKRGYVAVVAKGFEQAKEVVKLYFLETQNGK